MNQVQRQVEDLVVAIFSNKREAEQHAVAREVAQIRADHASRGMSQSGSYVLSVTRAYEAAVIRTVEHTLEELALQFRQAGRRDATLFWNLVEPKIKELTNSFSSSAEATAASQMQGLNPGLLARKSGQIWIVAQQLVSARVHELRSKSQFITLKTPDDRRANGVPDVAVMMWFPDPKTDRPEDIEAAKQRFESIRQAAVEASNGQATVNKFDDPAVIPQD